MDERMTIELFKVRIEHGHWAGLTRLVKPLEPIILYPLFDGKWVPEYDEWFVADTFCDDIMDVWANCVTVFIAHLHRLYGGTQVHFTAKNPGFWQQLVAYIRRGRTPPKPGDLDRYRMTGPGLPPFEWYAETFDTVPPELIESRVDWQWSNTFWCSVNNVETTSEVFRKGPRRPRGSPRRPTVVREEVIKALMDSGKLRWWVAGGDECYPYLLIWAPGIENSILDIVKESFSLPVQMSASLHGKLRKWFG